MSIFFNYEKLSLCAYETDFLWCGLGDFFEKSWVVTENGFIKDILFQAPTGIKIVRLGHGLLMPGLINAHTHLELSFLFNSFRYFKMDFLEWVKGILHERSQYHRKYVNEAVRQALKFASRQGTILIGDITNINGSNWVHRELKTSIVSFLEIIGIKKRIPFQFGAEWNGNLFNSRIISLHSPYSVSARNMRIVKEYALKNKFPISIHLAESRAEMEFFKGKGENGIKFFNFLESLGIVKKCLTLNSDNPLEHLLINGIIDNSTLIVHGIHLKEKELRLLAEQEISLCVCPRSNLNLTRNIIDVATASKLNVNLALGTDSLASTPDLSLWSEIKKLTEVFPKVKSEFFLNMATMGGAKALGLDKFFGKISVGYSTPLLFVSLTKRNNQDILDQVIKECRKILFIKKIF